jgi:hypothetical protein
MKTGHRLKENTMTKTAQIHSRCNIVKTEKPKLTENEENIRDILSVCDSLNKLHDTLGRLGYIIKKKKYRNKLS